MIAAAWTPPVAANALCSPASRSGSAMMTSAGTVHAASIRGAVMRVAASDGRPHIPQDAFIVTWRLASRSPATRAAHADERVTSAICSSARTSSATTSSSALDHTFAEQKPSHQVAIAAGRAHDDRKRFSVDAAPRVPARWRPYRPPPRARPCRPARRPLVRGRRRSWPAG